MYLVEKGKSMVKQKSSYLSMNNESESCCKQVQMTGCGGNMSLVSVVVPIYKVENYICRCIDSIVGQTYRNLEIILVDDGSPDNCPVICDEYAKKDARIKVIHKMNGGLSDARNIGMRAASGDYLMFVDSDDWIEKKAVEILYRLLISHDAQIAIGGMQRVEDKSNRILKSDFNGTKNIVSMTQIQAMKAFFENGCAAWGRLYRRSIHSGIEFPVGEINEDEAIVLSLLERCNIVVQTSEIVYNYRCRAESITTASFSDKKLAWYRHCEQNLEWIKIHYPELERCAAERLCSSIMWSLTEIALAEVYNPAWIGELKECLITHYKLFKKCYNHGVKQTTRLFVLHHFPFAVYRSAIRRKRGYKRTR